MNVSVGRVIYLCQICTHTHCVEQSSQLNLGAATAAAETPSPSLRPSLRGPCAPTGMDSRDGRMGRLDGKEKKLVGRAYNLVTEKWKSESSSGCTHIGPSRLGVQGQF